jgi:hypothetical protein
MAKFKIVIEAESKLALMKELAKKGITVESIQEKSPDENIINSLREVTCPSDGIESNEEIIEFLRGADEKTLDENAHGFEFKDKGGNTIEIIMWENCDHFTLRNLYEHIGI